MTEVPRGQEEALWVLCLQPAYSRVEDTTHSSSVKRGGHIHSHHDSM